MVEHDINDRAGTAYAGPLTAMEWAVRLRRVQPPYAATTPLEEALAERDAKIAELEARLSKVEALAGDVSGLTLKV